MRNKSRLVWTLKNIQDLSLNKHELVAKIDYGASFFADAQNMIRQGSEQLMKLRGWRISKQGLEPDKFQLVFPA